jgi:hypothetical protein
MLTLHGQRKSGHVPSAVELANTSNKEHDLLDIPNAEMISAQNDLSIKTTVRVCRFCRNEVVQSWMEWYTCDHCNAMIHQVNTELTERPKSVS